MKKFVNLVMLCVVGCGGSPEGTFHDTDTDGDGGSGMVECVGSGYMIAAYKGTTPTNSIPESECGQGTPIYVSHTVVNPANGQVVCEAQIEDPDANIGFGGDAFTVCVAIPVNE